MNEQKWRQFREMIAIGVGAAALVFGIIWKDPATMTIGAGLVGFSPASKGPVRDESE